MVKNILSHLTSMSFQCSSLHQGVWPQHGLIRIDATLIISCVKWSSDDILSKKRFVVIRTRKSDGGIVSSHDTGLSRNSNTQLFPPSTCWDNSMVLYKGTTEFDSNSKGVPVWQNYESQCNLNFTNITTWRELTLVYCVFLYKLLTGIYNKTKVEHRLLRDKHVAHHPLCIPKQTHEHPL